MVVFPNCKINIGLHIINKRPDGYHNLSTIFYPVPLRDSLEVITATNNSTEPVQLTQTGLSIAGNLQDNLCVKAYHLLKQDYPQLPSIQVHLHKAIPMGAGLGGGSADGAFMLRLLNDKYHLQISNKKLIHYALQLGSDCPFFIINKPCMGNGRGELLNPITVELRGYHLVLINPGIHVPTGWAFNALAAMRQEQPVQPSIDLSTAIAGGLSNWRQQIVNDFEAPVFAAHPLLKDIKSMLYEKGAQYASMSGSGSTMYGIFEKAPAFEAKPGWIIQHCPL